MKTISGKKTENIDGKHIHPFYRLLNAIRLGRGFQAEFIGLPDLPAVTRKPGEQVNGVIMHEYTQCTSRARPAQRGKWALPVCLLTVRGGIFILSITTMPLVFSCYFLQSVRVLVTNGTQLFTQIPQFGFQVLFFLRAASPFGSDRAQSK